MPQLLSVFRAARLVGVSRGTLQRKIHDEGTTTFEGKIRIDDLLTLFPKTELQHDSEYDRVQHIKKHAFAKRVREHLLPDADVLTNRVAELGRDLASTRSHLAQYQTILDQVITRLRETGESPTKKEVHGLLHWIKGTLAEPPMPSDPRKDLFANDTVLRIMAAHIKIQPSNHEFWLEGNDSILEAGVHSGLALNYGCTSGNCGLCKARVISGQVKKIQQHDYVLSEAEKNMNYMLMCSCTAVTDVVLEALEASNENDIPTQEVITKVKSIEQVTDNMLIMHVRTPRIQRLRFLAGQSVTLSHGSSSGKTISGDFPIASCPCDDRNLLFHIPRSSRASSNPTANTDFAEALLHNTKKGDEITVIGPHGHFLFNEESQRPQFYLAYDAGFAPIKSLIEHAMALEIPATMDLFWAVNKKEDLYINNLCRAWEDALENFNYHPVIKQDAVEQLLAHQTKLEKVDVYIAGPKTSIEHAGERLLAAGLPTEQLIMTMID